jgi:hypothetical protein
MLSIYYLIDNMNKKLTIIPSPHPALSKNRKYFLFCPGSVIAVQIRTPGDSKNCADHLKSSIPAWHAACIIPDSLV